MTRSFLFFAALLPLLLVSCTTDQRSAADRRFEDVATRFIETWLASHPEQATALGDRRFDDRLNDYTRDGVDADIALYRAYIDTLRSIKVEELSAAHMIDYDIMRQNLTASLFSLEEMREWEWNPLSYNPGEALYGLVARDGTSFSARMKALVARLKGVGAVLDAARANLSNPPAIHTETAIVQNDGVIALLTGTVQTCIDSVDSPLRAELSAARDSALSALRGYGAWLAEDLLPRSRRDFRLGAELYAKKFRHRLDTETNPEDLLQQAWLDLARTKEEMYQVALPLYGELFDSRDAAKLERDALIRAVLTKLSDQHSNDNRIVEQARRDLVAATDFVKARGLVTVPAEPLEIIVMPEFQRGVAVAYCDSPGPLEKNGKTFFAIAPTPATWTDARRESFYREYNDHMLRNLVVHEAMPGHYLQLAAANKAEAPTLLRAIMPSGVFAEGWATYTEQLMADAGFGGAAMKMQQLKMRLRLLINAILDQSVHTAGMSEQEGMTLMMEQGFQEEGEAAGKWRRACLTSVQLSSYYYGNRRINDIRTRYQQQAGAQFDLRTFHDTLLSFGTISPKYLPVLLKLPSDATSPAEAAGREDAERRPG
jgi:uncharacterized protein (DUF885 family)